MANSTHRITTKRHSQNPPAQSVKLPYLKPVQPMQYFHEHEETSPPRKEFNLFINQSKMPSYDPSKDKNLAYFFDKPTNRKLLQDLKEAERSKHESKSSSRTQRHNSRMNKSTNAGVVSQHQFQQYLNQMKAKARGIKRH